MFVREKDAGMMYCGPYVQNQDGISDVTKYCNGKHCMMWRWKTTGTGNDQGYCGLAGRPR